MSYVLSSPYSSRSHKVFKFFPSFFLAFQKIGNIDVFVINQVGIIISFQPPTISAPPEDVFNNGFTYIRAMALDWTTGNMYYVDTGRSTITVKNVNDPDLWKDLIAKDLGFPAGIAVSPKTGYLSFHYNYRVHQYCPGC